jgi:hypothetical protein
MSFAAARLKIDDIFFIYICSLQGVAELGVQGSGPPSQDQDHLCESRKSDEFVGGSMKGGYHGCCMCHPGPIQW